MKFGREKEAGEKKGGGEGRGGENSEARKIITS